MRYGDLRAFLQGMPDNHEVRMVRDGVELDEPRYRLVGANESRLVWGDDLPAPVVLPDAEPLAPGTDEAAAVEGAAVDGAA